MKNYHNRIRSASSLTYLQWRMHGNGGEVAMALCNKSIGMNNYQRAKKMAMRRALIASRMREDATMRKNRYGNRIKVRDITPALIMAITRKTANIK